MTSGAPHTEFLVAVDPAHPPAPLRRAVYAIGNFDGVHLGHRAVLERTCALARERGAPCAVLTFEPHPADYFAGKPVVFRLTPFPAKAAAIEALGLDGLVSLTFDAALAGHSAEAFVEDVLCRGLDVGAVVVGWDFHFGKGRSGSPAFLQRMGEKLGFSVEVIAKVESPDADAEVVSSTGIRRALERGDVETAARWLGRPYSVEGPVISGQRLGRTLGVPTANLALAPTNRLTHGVYAVRARVEGRAHDGVASFGVRPSVDNGAPLLETYIFDFDADIYGRDLRVEFVARIRDELKFDTLEALKAEMARDMMRARELLAARPVGDRAQIL